MTEIHKCQCGFEWKHGMSGSHMCEPHYRKQIEALLKERDALERELCMSEAKCKGYFSDAAIALLKCDALAADNVELKELIEQHANSFSVCPNCSHEEPSETDDIVALYRSLKTPATDAAIANIQAQHLEKFGDELLSDLRGDCWDEHDIKYIEMQLTCHLDELRKEPTHD